MEVQNTEKQIAIIGAGPVGLFAVFQCGMLGLRSIVIDSLADIGGQCSALYPDKPIYDIPSHPTISGTDLIAALEKQAAPFSPDYRLNVQVTNVSGSLENGFVLRLSNDDVIEASAVIIAAGAGSFGPNRPPLDGIQACEGCSVHYMVRKAEVFAGQKIAIAGGGDSAVDWTVALSAVADHITLIHRRDKFRAAPAMVSAMHDLVAQGKVTLKTPYQMQSLTHKDGQITALNIHEIGNTNGETIAIDALLPFYGLATDLGPITTWGIEIDGADNAATIPVSPVTAQTNIPGIYAVGDVASYAHKLKLILTGFSECAMAAHHIKRHFNDGQDWHMEYSTTKGVAGF